MLPSIDIVVPVLNEAASIDTLSTRLSGLAASQIVIVDGGSRDDTVPKLRAAGFTVIESPRGRAQQMNVGAAHGHSDVLLFLHADTTFSAEHVAAAQRAIADGADFGCFGVCIDSTDPVLRLVGSLITLRSRLIVSATGDQAIFMRRSLFSSLRGYREIALCEDLDLIHRAQGCGRFICLNRSVETSARRWQQRGVFRTILLMWALRIGCHAGIDPATLRRLYEDAR